MGTVDDGAGSCCTREEVSPGCVAIHVRGDVDAATSPEVEQALLAELKQLPNRLIVNLAEVTYFDSAGIRALIALRQRAGERLTGIRLVLPRREAVRHTLVLVGVDQLFTVCDSLAAAEEVAA